MSLRCSLAQAVSSKKYASISMPSLLIVNNIDAQTICINSEMGG